MAESTAATAAAAAVVKIHDEDDMNDVEGPPPSAQHSTLRRVPDRIPWVVLLILIVELGERFTYFGLSAPIQNYIKYVRPYHDYHLYRPEASL
mgnify:CR=1 FL=1